MRLNLPASLLRLPALLLVSALLAACGGQPAAPSVSPAASASALPSVTATIPTPVPTLAPPTAGALPGATVPAPTATPAPTTVALPPRPSRFGEELLFLRNRTLTARSLADGRERLLADDLVGFAVDPSGRLIALLRERSISLLERGGGPERLLADNLTAAQLIWLPDGLALLFSRAAADSLRPTDWPSWSAWCAAAEVLRLDLATAAQAVLGRGCDPAAASDGRRIAYTAPPQQTGQGYSFAGERNRIVLINRAGANGWAPAAAGSGTDDGLLVYAPAFSPAGNELAFERFVGYRALVDVNLTEIRNLNGEQNDLLIGGFGWGTPPLFAPDGSRVAVVENNWSDPRGVGGYEPWALNLVNLSGSRQVALPAGEVPARGDRFAFLSRVTAAAWAPDSRALAVQLPADWTPAADPYQPLFEQFDAGALWLVAPDGTPLERLADNADPQTPLAWLPAEPQLLSDGARRIAAPADWQPAGPLAAAAAARRIELLVLPAAVADADLLRSTPLRDAQLDAPLELPDGSRLLSLRALTPDGVAVAGAVRVLPRGETTLVALVYAESAGWPLWRAAAIALLGSVQ
jgi:hypothetical protein